MCIARRTVIVEAHKAQLDPAEAEAIEAARRSVEQAKWQKYANLIDEGPEIPENPAKYFAADEPRAAPHDDAGVGSGPPAADHGTGWAWPNPSCLRSSWTSADTTRFSVSALGPYLARLSQAW
jgi:hypothetical protein